MIEGDGVMDREEAIALCRDRCLKETTVRHLISVEGVMRALALGRRLSLPSGAPTSPDPLFVSSIGCIPR